MPAAARDFRIIEGLPTASRASRDMVRKARSAQRVETGTVAHSTYSGCPKRTMARAAFELLPRSQVMGRNLDCRKRREAHCFTLGWIGHRLGWSLTLVAALTIGDELLRRKRARVEPALRELDAGIAQTPASRNSRTVSARTSRGRTPAKAAASRNSRTSSGASPVRTMTRATRTIRPVATTRIVRIAKAETDEGLESPHRAGPHRCGPALSWSLSSSVSSCGHPASYVAR